MLRGDALVEAEKHWLKNTSIEEARKSKSINQRKYTGKKKNCIENLNKEWECKVLTKNDWIDKSIGSEKRLLNASTMDGTTRYETSGNDNIPKDA